MKHLTIEIYTIISEFALLFGFVFIVFARYGHSLEYYIIGFFSLWVLSWRLQRLTEPSQTPGDSK